MGCFNVACSISSISIGDGTRVALIPLSPATGRLTKAHVIEPASSILQANHFFNPLTLPIFGTYDDYGSIDNIVRDDNVKAIERFFKIDIEDFVALLNCGRPDINDSHSELARLYAKDKTILSFGAPLLDGTLLESFGFEAIPSPPDEACYVYPDSTFTVTIRLDSHDPEAVHYSITSAYREVEKKSFGNRSITDFLEDYYELTGYHLNVEKEHQNHVKLFSQISGMFVHGEIYDELASDRILQANMEQRYDRLMKEMAAYEAERVKLDINDPDFPSNLYFLRCAKDPFQSFTSDYDGILYQFGEWTYFKKLYQDSFVNEELLDALKQYHSFSRSMYRMNRFFFPAMNGEQHGDIDASRKLYAKSLEITERQIKEREEW